MNNSFSATLRVNIAAHAVNKRKTDNVGAILTSPKQ